MNDHFAEAGLQISCRVQVKVFPFTGTEGRVGDHDRVENDILLRETGEKSAALVLKSERQERQMIFMGDFGKNRKEFGSGKERSHVSVEMSGVDPRCNRVFDLS